MKSEHQKQEMARRAARRIKVSKAARAMVRKVDSFPAVDQEIRSMRDEIVKLMHEIGQLKKKPSNRVTLQ